MNGWRTQPVSALIDGLTAGVSVRSTTSQIGGPSVLKTSAIGRGRFDPRESKTILPDDISRAKCPVLSDSLIISRMNTPALVGDVGYVDKNHDSLYLPDRLWLAKARRGTDTDMRWLTYYFCSERGSRDLQGLATGTSGSMKNIPKRRVLDLEISTPSESEQHSIANAIAAADDLIATLERLIAKKQALKQGMVQQLLTGRTRLPGFGHSGMRPTDVGEFPSDWSLDRLVNLVDATRPIRYGIVQPGQYDPRGRYMIRGQDYSEAKGWADPQRVFRVSDRVEAKYRNARVQRGDLLMTIVGYAGHVDMVPACFDGANITQTSARISIDPRRAVPEFCRYALQSPAGRRQVERYLKGAAQPGLNIRDVETFQICLPPADEQRVIASALSAIDADADILRVRLKKARLIKTGMMQQLLTGRVRLPVEASA